VGVGKIRAVAKALIDELGLVAGGAAATPLTRANMLVHASNGSWGSWGIWTSTAMQTSGHGQVSHLDNTSAIVQGASYGSRFAQRCSGASGWQTIGSDYNGDLFRANTGLQFVHELDCIPFDDETNPCLANCYILMWGLWNQRSTSLIGVGGLDPASLHGCGIRFKVGTDTNFQFCSDTGTSSLTLVDSGLAPVDGTRYIFRAVYDGFVASSGSCRLEILDGDKTVLATTTLTANGPAANNPINPRIFWQSDGTSLVRSLSIIHQQWAMGLPD